MKRGRDINVIFGAAVLTGAVAALAGAVAGVFAGSPAGSALASEPAAGAPPNEASRLPVPELAAAPLPGDVMSIAARKAPFDPERRAPASRYLLPQDRVSEEPTPPPPPPPPPPPEFRVLGTIGGREGGVAVIAAQGEPPRVVAVGEEVMGYSLASVGEGRVVVTRDGRDVSVMMEDANASVVAAAGNRRGQQTRAASRAGGGRAQESSETTFFDAARLQMQVGERVREALERLEQRRQPEGNQGRTNGQRGQATQRSSPRPPGGG